MLSCLVWPESTVHPPSKISKEELEERVFCNSHYGNVKVHSRRDCAEVDALSGIVSIELRSLRSGKISRFLLHGSKAAAGAIFKGLNSIQGFLFQINFKKIFVDSL